tara:strand:+ start:38 stop:430 length:393 start_codon:yes stop_codon:yes gene_type:complete
MLLKEMKAFASLTDEERQQKIWVEEHRVRAEVEFFTQCFCDWKGRDTDYNQGASCGCSNIRWSLTKGANEDFQRGNYITFNVDGKIIMDDYMLDSVVLGDMVCENCGEQPKMPEWYLEDFVQQIVEASKE